MSESNSAVLTPFSELIAALSHAGDDSAIDLPADWLQGRTAYGGLSAAVCLEAVLRRFPEAPPLRSAQFCFVGPASGRLNVRVAALRRGKSTLHVGADLSGESGLALRATFCFGLGRDSALPRRQPMAPEVAAPEACAGYFSFPERPHFMDHFEGRLAGGARPCTPAAAPAMHVWLRHRDAGDDSLAVRLLALADALPPAATVCFERWRPVSTMTWSVELLSDAPSTRAGWWLLDCRAETAAQGYSVQHTTLWNREGQAMLLAMQHVAVFG